MAKKKKKSRGSSKEVTPKHEVPSGFGRQVFAISLTLLAILIAIAAFGARGSLLTTIFQYGEGFLGYSMYALIIILPILTVKIFRAYNYKLPFVVWFWTLILIVCISGISALPTIDGPISESTGGLLGGWLSKVLVDALSIWGAAIIYVFVTFIIGAYLLSKDFKTMFINFGNLFKTTRTREDKQNAKVAGKIAVVDQKIAEKQQVDDDFSHLAIKKGVRTVDDEAPKSKHSIPQAVTATIDPEIAANDALIDKNWKLPTLDLLDEHSGAANAGDTTANARIIRDTFAEFEINVTVEGADIGPRVTQYKMTPSSGVKLSRIAGMDRELARALSADKIRIEAPIPKTSLVGVEVPNVKQADVGIREILDSPEWKDMKADLPFAVGKDISGSPVVSDLAKMPHLLIAGTTGSGKSVMMNTLILSLLYRNTPSDLKLVLVDPKQVELASYSEIRHLITPIITNTDGAMSALTWAVKEMEERYSKFKDHRAKNIREYNDIAKASPADGDQHVEKLPYIVVVVDEMADLMMQAGKDLENLIVRIAQKGRASGMHLVLATQRPEVKVITGLIKANIPGRIAFAVGSSIDSRVMLDQNGAEKLLGRGDMLFLTTEMMGKPRRVQGAFASEKSPKDIGDIERVTNYIRSLGPPRYDEEVSNQHVSYKGSMGTSVTGDEFGRKFDPQDPLVRRAVQISIESGKFSTSNLQTYLGKAHGFVSGLALWLYSIGVIGEPNGKQPRDVLISSMEEFDELANGADLGNE
jgi:S-DNA-T family DNA segregation ATPase FtsK/SpoIIIE